MARSITLTGVDGTVWDMCGGVVNAGGDPRLWGLPPAQISARSSAALPGARVTARRHLPRDLILPIKVLGSTPGDVETAVAAFARALDPVQGDVTITVERPDGSARKITATYLAGWDQLGVRWRGETRTAGNIALRAHDPYWTNVADETVAIIPPPPVFASGTTAWSSASVPFSDAIPFDGYAQGTGFNDVAVPWNAPIPWSGGAGGVVVFTITDTGGDVDVWPWFTVVGPCSVVEGYNLSSGQRWSFPAGLAAGQTLIVDSRPRSRRVVINEGNAWGAMAGGLWSMRPSTSQTIAIRFDGTTDGVSSMAMRWLPQWLTC